MPYIVTFEDRYEPGEVEMEFDNFDDAWEKASGIVDDGGWAVISDGENIWEI